LKLKQQKDLNFTNSQSSDNKSKVNIHIRLSTKQTG
jgi:hypothetical protein